MHGFTFDVYNQATYSIGFQRARPITSKVVRWRMSAELAPSKTSNLRARIPYRPHRQAMV